MNNATRIFRVSALALAVAATAAYAHTGKTRGQVEAELMAAEQAGDVPGPAGVPLRAIYPSMYPAASAAPGKAREEVEAELMAAEQAGDVPGPAGVPLRAIYPSMYPAAETAGSTAHSGASY